MTVASYAKQIAADVIAQMQAGDAPPWPCEFTAQYTRMYLDDLETMQPAGGPTPQLQIVVAPVEPKFQRIGWGGGRITITLGVLFNVKVQTANGEVTDPNIDAYELFVDQFCTWLIGPRLFADVWHAADPLAVFGDHYNDHLYDKEEFHVPVLVDFVCAVGVS